jgi:hypothetical protein
MADASPPIDFTTMSEEALAGCWFVVGLDVPEALVQETLRRGSRMVPLLGPMIGVPTAWEDLKTDAGWAPPHALMLLCAIGGPEIIPYAVACLHHGLGGDWMAEVGPTLVCAGGMDGLVPMAEVIGDSHADVYGRWTAVDGLCLLGLTHEEHRPKVSGVLRRMAQAYTERPEDLFTEDDRLILTQLGEVLAVLHDESSMEISERAFAAGRWDTYLCPFSDLGTFFKTPFEESLELFRMDPMKHFSKEELARLQEQEANRRMEPDEGSPMEAGREGVHRMEEAERVVQDASGPSPPSRGTPVRVGRNDPCPCESGKKFKKCCGG